MRCIMFEHIYFHANSGTYNFSDIKQDLNYQNLSTQNELLKLKSQEYQIDGEFKYLLPRPMSDSSRKYFLYLQAFSYMKSGAGYYTRRESYNSYLISFTYGGKGCLQYDGKEYELKSGDGFILDCRKSHTYMTQSTSWIHSDLHINGGNISHIYESLFQEKVPVFHFSNIQVFQCALEKVLLAHQNGAPNRELKFSNETGELLLLISDAHLEPQKNKFSEEMNYLQQYIELHFTEDLTLDALSKFCCISKYHMIRLFQAHTGFTPHEYIIHLRLLNAENLLRMTTLTCAQVSALSGFANEALFIKHFKKAYEMTPKKYRQLFQT